MEFGLKASEGDVTGLSRVCCGLVADVTAKSA